MWYFIPPEDFFEYISNPTEHLVLLGFVLGISLFLILDIVFIKENFCVYVCPYSRVQLVLYDDDTLQAVYDTNRGGDIYSGKGYERQKDFNKKKDLLIAQPNAECTTCESCVTVCPTYIYIRKGMQLECINCLECVDACTTVMDNLGKESLVRWSSEREAMKYEGKTRYLRAKTLAYFGILLVVLISLFVMGSKKENMLLNINKGQRLYKIVDNTVENDYIFMFSNTDNKDHKYYFEVLNKNIKIKKAIVDLKLTRRDTKKIGLFDLFVPIRYNSINKKKELV